MLCWALLTLSAMLFRSEKGATLKTRKEARREHDAFPGAENGQSLLRVQMILVFYFVIVLYWATGNFDVVAKITPAATAYLLFATTWWAITRWKLIALRPRRALSILLDHGIVAYGFWSGDAISAVFIGACTFATIGYGIIYGRRYQRFSLVVSTVAMSTALFLSEYWHELPLVSLGILATLILVPSYSLSLSERIARARDRAELRVSKLERVNRVDALTGLLNRRAFRRVFSSILSRGKSGYLVFLDLDNFKQVNDRYGHAAGDDLLQEIAKVFERCLRSYDIVARHAGDEFTVLFTDTEDTAVRAICARIRSEIEQLVLERYGNVAVSSSMGICSYYGRGAQDVSALIQRADEYMYAAKESGQGQINFCGELISGDLTSLRIATGR